MQESGKVKWFNAAKGYGFISRDLDGADVFVHYSSIDGDGYRSLKEGEEVAYGLTTGPKGLQALEVVRHDAAVGAAV